MIRRQFRKGDAASTAEYSDCQRFRYVLTRVWCPGGPRVLFVMLNPSTATECQNDPTVERCERRARALGFGGVRVTNIFAFRATDPRLMRAVDDPVGPGNDAAILGSVAWADQIVCAWGAHGAHRGRGRAVARMLRRTGAALFHLGLTKDGEPRHPLYVAYSVSPLPWGSAGDARGRGCQGGRARHGSG